MIKRKVIPKNGKVNIGEMKPSNDPIINMAAQEFKMKRESQEIQ